ncbi:unnamed protein product [Acanthosepion pharaonis]|uniref:Uncharacterized protein n=1 Tax=Acanthosepion pharaonis TaxID=158019 RepID=A0A812C9G1_ACAPH|nr:unnamed protein product [Sepia pharaonis]
MSKRMTAERRGATVVEELKKCESTLDMEKNEIARKESEVISLSEQLRNKVTEMTDCETKIKDVEEIRTNLKTCEENKIGINQELQKKKDELKAAFQQSLPQDAEQCKLCKGQWIEEKRNFLNSIEKALGRTTLMQLREAGVDIGIYAQEIDAQHKSMIDQQNPQGNGKALPQGQVNLVNVANGQANQLPQEQSLQVQPQAAQVQNNFPLPHLQGQAPVVMVQSAQDNNVPQGQVQQANPPAVNPAVGTVVETNALAVNGESAVKVNSMQSENAVVNNPPPENQDVPHPPDFAANPGFENAGQVVNDAANQPTNPVAAEKGADSVVANAAEQPAIQSDSVLNRVERPPSDMNKTTAGNSLMSLNKSNTPLPKEALSASNSSFSSRAPAQSVQTDIQPALHASQSNNTDNNQTLDLRLGHGLPTANLAESNDQMKFKQNAEPVPIDDHAGETLKDSAAKGEIGQSRQGGIVQDEDSIDKMQHNMNMEDDRMNHGKTV